mgnify:FL=1
MPVLNLKEENTGKSNKLSEPVQKSSGIKFWTEIAKDVLHPFAPKIPSIARFKCQQQAHSKELEEMRVNNSGFGAELFSKPKRSTQNLTGILKQRGKFSSEAMSSLRQKALLELQLPIDRYKRLKLVDDSPNIMRGSTPISGLNSSPKNNNILNMKNPFEESKAEFEGYETRSQTDIHVDFDLNPFSASSSGGNVRRKSASGWLFGDCSKFEIKTSNIVIPPKGETTSDSNRLSTMSTTSVTKHKLSTQKYLPGRSSLVPANSLGLRMSAGKSHFNRILSDEVSGKSCSCFV